MEGGGEIDVEEAYRKYGPMVLRRCRRLLRDEDEAWTYPGGVRARDEAPGPARRALPVEPALPHRDEPEPQPAARPPTGAGAAGRRGAAPHRRHQDQDAPLLLDRLFGRHPESTRTMAVLHHLDGMTLEQVARECGMSVSGVRRRLRRAARLARGDGGPMTGHAPTRDPRLAARALSAGRAARRGARAVQEALARRRRRCARGSSAGPSTPRCCGASAGRGGRRGPVAARRATDGRAPGSGGAARMAVLLRRRPRWWPASWRLAAWRRGPPHRADRRDPRQGHRALPDALPARRPPSVERLRPAAWRATTTWCSSPIRPRAAATASSFRSTAAGCVTRHLPAAGARAAPLSRARPVPLPEAYELDDAPGFERFFLVTADDAVPRRAGGGGGAPAARRRAERAGDRPRLDLPRVHGPVQLRRSKGGRAMRRLRLRGMLVAALCRASVCLA